MVLGMSQYIEAPIMMQGFHFYFETIQPVEKDGIQFLDFSKPGFHTYIRHNTGFYFPSIPEDDSMDAYLHAFVP